MAQSGTAIRGRRVPLTRLSRDKDAREVLGYVCGAKTLPFGLFMLTEGVEVPGATGWTRVEAWVSARRIRPVYEGDDFTTFDDFVARIVSEAWDEAHAEHLLREISTAWDEAHAEYAARVAGTTVEQQSEEAKAAELLAKRQAAAAKAREAKLAKKAAETAKE